MNQNVYLQGYLSLMNHVKTRMKLSIITATYNSASTIERCLTSVAEQIALSQIEHIIIDGRSSDKTLTLVSNFPHVAKVISEEDHGVYDAFNKGLSAATGDLIYYLGSDDHLSDINTIHDIISEFSKQKGMDYIAAKVVIKDPVTAVQWVSHGNKLCHGENIFNHPHHQGFFMRRRLLQEYGGFPRSFNIAADSYIMLKTIVLGKGIFSDRIVSHFYQGGLSSKNDNSDLLHRETRIIYDLLNLDKNNKQKMDVANKNMMYMKQLLHSHLEEEHDLTEMKDKVIGIFGTGVMASIVYLLLEKAGVTTSFFITSLGSDSDFHGKKVWSLSKFPSDVQVLFNSIEGEHYDEVAQQLNKKAPAAHLVKWHDIY